MATIEVRLRNYVTLPNPQRIQLLIDALRSGQYQQGFRRLTTIDPDDGQLKHCCLGVACQVAIANGVPVEVEEAMDNQDGQPVAMLRYDRHVSFLPQRVMEWYGFPSSDPTIHTENNFAAGAAGVNDFGKPFTVIANGFARSFDLPVVDDAAAG